MNKTKVQKVATQLGEIKAQNDGLQAEIERLRGRDIVMLEQVC